MERLRNFLGEGHALIGTAGPSQTHWSPRRPAPEEVASVRCFLKDLSLGSRVLWASWENWLSAPQLHHREPPAFCVPKPILSFQGNLGFALP